MRTPRLLGIAAGLLLAAPAVWAKEAPAASSSEISPEASRLIKQLDDADAYARQTAFIKLEMLREAATAPEVRKYLDSSDDDTRSFSVRALAAIEGVKAVPALIERLKRDRSAQVRVAAILALEPLPDPAILPAFIEKLRDRDRDVRMAAVDAVSRVKQPEARAAIRLRWRRERDRDVRRVLTDAMARVSES